MDGQLQLDAQDRPHIREGGGCLSVFGLPFLGAGVLLFLILIGVVPVSNADEMPGFMWPILVLMAVAFTTVGGALVFGRRWITVDRAQRQLITQRGLLIPMHEQKAPLAGYTVVTLGFNRGDSDTADSYPVELRGPGGPVLSLYTFANYANARECAKAVATHLQFEIVDASTDHPVRQSASQLDVPFRQRQWQESAPSAEAVRPPDARSQVTRDMGRVTIVIPARPMHALTLATTLIPIGILITIGPPLSTFFKESNTPDPVGWAFLGFLALFFGLLPISTIVGSFLRSRRGGTIVEVSRERLRILERGIWRTRPIVSFDADDILDVDYSSRESVASSARRAAEEQAFAAHPDAPRVVSPRVDRIITKLARFAQGRGVTIKTRTGITAFGQGLGDEEVHYLCSVVRRALAG